MSNITQKEVEFIKPFTNLSVNNITACWIARKTRTPQQSVSRLLNKLARFGVVGYKKQGRNNLFYLKYPKSEALSHQLSWPHYFGSLNVENDELVAKCDHLKKSKYFPQLPYTFTEKEVDIMVSQNAIPSKKHLAEIV